MKKKLYDKPSMEIIEADVECQILAGSTYEVTITTGLNTMDGDEDMDDAAQMKGNSIWGMGADEEL